jgi:hypothetical protein
MPKYRRLLIVGAGLTGAAAQARVSELAAGSLDRLSIHIWEKSVDGTGGRFCTKHETPQTAGAAPAHVDLGAQYISAQQAHAGSAVHRGLYAELLEAGVLRRLELDGRGRVLGDRGQPGQSHYAAPAGVGAVVHHLLTRTPGSVELGRALASVAMRRTHRGWDAVAADAEGREESFDAVVFTLPTPQLLELAAASPALDAAIDAHRWASVAPGAADDADADAAAPRKRSRLADGGAVAAGPGRGSLRAQLAATRYSSRFALGLYLPREVSTAPIDYNSNHVRRRGTKLRLPAGGVARVRRRAVERLLPG